MDDAIKGGNNIFNASSGDVFQLIRIWKNNSKT